MDIAKKRVPSSWAESDNNLAHNKGAKYASVLKQPLFHLQLIGRN